ncbi:hypothetical protein ACU045_04125 [Microbacterium sp. MAHUQ-60]|uniref:hypothetical protein n=1 Tax=unclassified Microbacterium TaxID=2609290 RepID=UPI003620D92B
MGLFSQKQQEPGAWAALPGEPLEEHANERLDEVPGADLMDVGLGAKYTTMVFPVAAPAPEAEDTSETGEPGADEPAE